MLLSSTIANAKTTNLSWFRRSRSTGFYSSHLAWATRNRIISLSSWTAPKRVRRNRERIRRFNVWYGNAKKRGVNHVEFYRDLSPPPSLCIAFPWWWVWMGEYQRWARTLCRSLHAHCMRRNSLFQHTKQHTVNCHPIFFTQSSSSSRSYFYFLLI